MQTISKKAGLAPFVGRKALGQFILLNIVLLKL